MVLLQCRHVSTKLHDVMLSEGASLYQCVQTVTVFLQVVPAIGIELWSPQDRDTPCRHARSSQDRDTPCRQARSSQVH
jgi:hypothetical protein